MAQRRFELLDRMTDPDKIAHIQYYGATAALAAGRPDEAEMLVRKHDIVASRLSPHHEVHALAVILFVEEALGHWDEVRRLQCTASSGPSPPTRGRRACSLRGRSSRVPSPAANSISTARRGDSKRPRPSRASEAVTSVPGSTHRRPISHCCGATWTGSTPCSRRLARRGNWSQDGSLYALATKLDALIALGRAEEAEKAATALLEPGTYLEPFALRALGRVRSDRALTEQAVERFEAMGLSWHAAKTVIGR